MVINMYFNNLLTYLFLMSNVNIYMKCVTCHYNKKYNNNNKNRVRFTKLIKLEIHLLTYKYCMLFFSSELFF